MMLALVFEVAGESYGVPAARVVQVVRRPEVRLVPGAPEWISGLFAWEGAWVPLVDLSRLIAHEPCPGGAASRVALVQHSRGNVTRLLGLLAPGMTRVTDITTTRTAPGLRLTGQEFLGPIAHDEELGVQMIEIERVLPRDIDRLLFEGHDEGAR
jgi:chemotaxis-related protein WspB